MKKVLFAVVIALNFLDVGLHAQEKKKITVDEAVKLAFRYSKELKSSNLDIEKSKKQVDEAYGNAYPTLSTNFSYTRNLKPMVMFLPENLAAAFGGNTQMEIGSDNSYSLGLSLNQVVYSQKVNTAIEIADKYLDMYKITLADKKNTVALNVKKAFYDVLFLKELIKVSEESYKVAKANLDNVEQSYKNGVASEYDFLRSQVQLANVEPVLIQSKNNYDLAMMNLKNSIGLNLNDEIEAVGELKSSNENIEDYFARNEEAVANNLKIRQLKTQEKLYDLNIKVEKADFYPTVSVNGSYSWQTQSNDFKFGDYKWAKPLSVGLNVSYNIFDGFKRNAKVEQATIDKAKAETVRMLYEDGLRLQLKQSVLKMQEALNSLKAQEKSLQQAEKALQISETRYKSGVGTQLELLDSQKSLTQSRTNYLQSAYQFLYAKSDWENLATAVENN